MNTASSHPLAVSNLAWPKESDEQALDLVAALGFAGVELAPGKVFADPATASEREIAAYRAGVENRGLRIAALQSILFGVEGALLFGSAPERARMTDHLRRMAELAAGLGASACVFGSPTLRDPGERDAQTALEEARAFFADLAPHYAAHGVALCFEANPELYGCRFATRTPDALALVEAVDASGFALQLDTGTILINGEDPNLIEEAGPRIGHFHMSEPGLRPVGTDPAIHAPIARALGRSSYEGWVSVEMKASEDWQGALRTAYDAAATTYGSAR